ncbi:MAG TPA: hypothetical protein VF228_00980 [Iamia sp.]
MAEQWWWDLTHARAVTSDERPRDIEVLGPYPTKEAAEDWRSTTKARNDAWDAEDARWEGDDPSEG